MTRAVKKLLVLFDGPVKKKTSLTLVSGIDMGRDGV